ncbi:MAG TPA: Mur ligase family protein [bacterium]|nr:Mur ligase family protein [bacterium]HPN31235.1 Mur ligase family protein [bacterium]
MIKSIKDFFRFVDSLSKHKIQPGLERIKIVLGKLGNPQLKYKSVHIAGTNGKGSTALFIAGLLKRSCYKTGLFVSPEILKYNDRISINGKNISDKELVFTARKIISILSETGTYLTEFEFCSVLMFQFFADQKISIAVLETGLGGRLDATNVTKPLVSIVTSISKDHSEYLGNNIKSIAAEKLDILKNSEYRIIGNLNYYKKQIAVKFLKTNNLINKKLFIYGNHYGTKEISGIPYFKNDVLKIPVKELNDLPEYQKFNFAAAVQTLFLLEGQNKIQKIDFGKFIEKIRLPFRMQKISELPQIIIDASHNPEAIGHFIKAVKANYSAASKIIVIYSGFRDKDYKTIIKLLSCNFQKIFIYNMRHPRGADLSGFGNQKKIFFFDSLKQIINFIGSNPDFQYFVTGSYQTARDFFSNISG